MTDTTIVNSVDIGGNELHDDDFRVEDLRVETVKDILKKEINVFCSEWDKIESDDDLHDLMTRLPKYDDIHSSIYSSNLQTMTLSTQSTFRKEFDSFLYNKAPNLMNKGIQSTSSNRTDPELVINVDEIILTIGVHSSSENILQQELELIGSSSLQEFIEAISCKHNERGSNDGFLFVNGVFYVDDSNKSRRQTIERIKQWFGSDVEVVNDKVHRYNSNKGDVRKGFQSRQEWLQTFGITNVDDIPVKSLSDTRCDAVSFELGARYLYSHCGSCEHFITLTDMRKCHPSLNNNLTRTSYPRVTYQKKMKRKRCSVCDINIAKFQVFGDRLSESNPCFYCDLCYHMLHYTEDDELLYDDYVVLPEVQD